MFVCLPLYFSFIEWSSLTLVESVVVVHLTGERVWYGRDPKDEESKDYVRQWRWPAGR